MEVTLEQTQKLLISGKDHLFHGKRGGKLSGEVLFVNEFPYENFAIKPYDTKSIPRVTSDAFDRLGIEVIAANSPQAKGRVERNHGVDQDRLVKDLRLEGISTIEKANKFLLEKYLPKMNEKFSWPARDSDDAHVKIGKVKLDDILCMEFDRTISKDYIVGFQARSS